MGVKKTLQDRLESAWKWNMDRKFPIFGTPIGTAGMLYAFSQGDYITGIIAQAIGSSVDVGRKIGVQRAVTKLKAANTDLEKVLDTDYLGEVIKQVREEYGFKGRCTVIEHIGKQAGTGIFQKGYFTEIALRFADGNEKRFFYKYAHDKNKGSDTHTSLMHTGARLTELLTNMGYDFMPKRIRPKAKTRLSTKCANRGEIYEWVDGETIDSKFNLGDEHEINRFDKNLNEIPAEDIFDEMFSMYREPMVTAEAARINPLQIRSPHFHKNLIKILSGFGEHEFLDSYDAEFNKTVPSEGPALIHGDLHQGNIMVTPEGRIKVPDWDSAHLGIPYQDFHYFSVISDLEKRPDYKRLKENFQARQNSLFPQVTEEQMKLLEFDNYIASLNRFFRPVKKRAVRSEFRPNMLKSCKYLLVKARESLVEYCKATGNNELVTQFDDYASQKYKKLEAVEFDSNASIAYGYNVLMKYNTGDLSDTALRNREAHKGDIEKLVVAEERERNIIGVDGALLTVYFAVGAGAMAYGYFQGEIPKEQFFGEMLKWTPLYLLTMGVVAANMHFEKVYNTINNLRERIGGKDEQV